MIKYPYPRLLLSPNTAAKGELLKKKETKSHFFKTFDNSRGKIRLNFTLENQANEQIQEIAVINFTAKAAGRSDLKPVVCEVLDIKMKKVESKFSPFTIKVEK